MVNELRRFPALKSWAYAAGGSMEEGCPSTINHPTLVSMDVLFLKVALTVLQVLMPVCAASFLI